MQNRIIKNTTNYIFSSLVGNSSDYDGSYYDDDDYDDEPMSADEAIATIAVLGAAAVCCGLLYCCYKIAQCACGIENSDPEKQTINSSDVPSYSQPTTSAPAQSRSIFGGHHHHHHRHHHHHDDDHHHSCRIS